MVDRFQMVFDDSSTCGTQHSVGKYGKLVTMHTSRKSMEMTVVGEGTMLGVACAMTCCVLIVDGEECDFAHLHRK